jgi:predicted nucleic acid-binding Zn ribbon protein
MANLIYCAACGHQISSAAKACPNCGHRKGSGIGKILINLILAVILIAVVLVIGLFIVFYSNSSNSNKPRIDIDIKTPAR